MNARDTGMGQTLRQRSRDESGSILVLFSLFLTLFLVLCAIVIDVGYWWANAKKAQIAADACALAAAQSIPGVDPSSVTLIDPDTGEILGMGECVIETGQPDYVLSNIPPQGGANKEPLHTGTWVEWPYVNSAGVSDSTRVEAIVKMKVGTFFGRIVGHGGIKIERRAVAEYSQAVNEVAIHAHDTYCGADGVILQNGPMNIEGIVESNGFFETSASKPITTGPATGGGPAGCDIKVSGDASFGGEDEPANDPIAHPWPIYFVPGEHPFGWPNSCDVTGDNLEYENGEPEGIWCAKESFEIKKDGTEGDITVFAPLIKVNAKNVTLRPSKEAVDAGKPLLFMHLPNSTETAADDGPEPDCEESSFYGKEMTLNGENLHWTGILFNPCAEIRINGFKNLVIEGMIVAQSVKVDGENFNLKKISIAGGNKTLALVE